MKAIKTTVAILFATLTLAACQQTAVEPMRPAQTAAAARPDSIPTQNPAANPVHILPADAGADDDAKHPNTQPMQVTENSTSATASETTGHPASSSQFQSDVMPAKLDSTSTY